MVDYINKGEKLRERSIDLAIRDKIIMMSYLLEYYHIQAT